MKTKQTLIAVCITALFASGAVMAKEKWEYNEDKWDDTRSYGRITIDQDSVSAWGPWEDFVEPAAGAPSVAFAGAGAGDPYRPLPNPIPIPVDDVCRSGDWCGYAIYRNIDNQRVVSEMKTECYGGCGDNDPPRPYAGIFGLTLSPNNPLAITIDGGEGPGQVSWRLAALPGNEIPLFGASHDPMSADFGASTGGGVWGLYDLTKGLHNFEASQQTSGAGILDSSAAEGFPRGGYDWVKHSYSCGHHKTCTYWTYDFFTRDYLPTNNPEVAVGTFKRITSYAYGDGEYLKSLDWETIQSTSGFFVAGIATPQAYLDGQRAGEVRAQYNGYSADYNGYQVPVKIDVNFGTASWSGSWNNGKDGGYVNRETDSAGNRYLLGAVGFKVDSGTINGVNLKSTALSASDKGGAIVTGTVQGTFFGQTAGSIGGVSDIVKQRLSESGYAPASNVGVFLVDKKIVD